MIETNKIYCENCLDTMARMPGNFIDLVVTSPPYDNLRDYKGYDFDFESIAKSLFRVIKKGGVVVWVVGDQTVNGSETGTSFKQALYFKEIGFNLHDTMIYAKNSFPFPPSNRYFNVWEYMFVFSKGKPKTFNLQRVKTVNLQRVKTVGWRQADGSMEKMKGEMGKDDRIDSNIWEFNVGFGKSSNEKEAFLHPATFPEKLAARHILSWSNEGDLVYDPFSGSGTTCKMAKEHNRNYIGSEISKEYCQIAEQRLKILDQNPRFF